MRPINDTFFVISWAAKFKAASAARAVQAAKNKAASAVKYHNHNIKMAARYEVPHAKYIDALCAGNKQPTSQKDYYHRYHAIYIKSATRYTVPHAKYIANILANKCTANADKSHDIYIKKAAKYKAPHSKYITNICAGPVNAASAASAASCIIKENKTISFDQLEKAVAKYYTQK